MIVESAFLKLPELLETSAAGSQVREATTIHAMATGVLIELNGRNIEHPAQHVVVEKRYQQSGPASAYAADLFVQLSGAVSRPELVAGYGYRENNWLEGKAFIDRPAPKRRPKSIGRIVRDILRLCLFPEEKQGAHRQNSRFLLLVSSADPQEFWRGSDDRRWITNLTTPGEHSIDIPVDTFNKSTVGGIGGIDDTSKIPRIGINVFNTTFRPDQTESPTFSRFWGSLSRINGFDISTDDWSLSFVDRSGARWEREQNDSLERARAEIVELLRPSGE